MLNTFYLNGPTQASLSSIELHEEDARNFEQYYEQDSMIDLKSRLLFIHLEF